MAILTMKDNCTGWLHFKYKLQCACALPCCHYLVCCIRQIILRAPSREPQSKSPTYIFEQFWDIFPEMFKNLRGCLCKKPFWKWFVKYKWIIRGAGNKSCIHDQSTKGKGSQIKSFPLQDAITGEGSGPYFCRGKSSSKHVLSFPSEVILQNK